MLNSITYWQIFKAYISGTRGIVWMKCQPFSCIRAPSIVGSVVTGSGNERYLQVRSTHLDHVSTNRQAQPVRGHLDTDILATYN